MFGQTIVLGMLVVNGNASATAHNILANETLYRIGFAIPLVAVGFHITWALLIYQLFRVVNRTINQLALLVILVGCSLQAAAAVVYLSPLLYLQAGFTQLDTVPLLINLGHLTFDVFLIFFGLGCVLLRSLIMGTTFMPRVIGAMLVADGLGWMTYLFPPLATSIFPAIAAVAGVAEFSLLLWMLILGVKSDRWYEQARASIPELPVSPHPRR